MENASTADMVMGGLLYIFGQGRQRACGCLVCGVISKLTTTREVVPVRVAALGAVFSFG